MCCRLRTIFKKLFVPIFVVLMQAFAISSAKEAVRPQHHTDEGFRNFPVTEDSADLGFTFYWKRFISSFSHPDVPQSHYLEENKALELYGKLQDENTITWIGQSTLLIKINGIVILTDPFFSEYASPFFVGPSRYVAPGISTENLPDIDIILISHNHYDHLDEDFVESVPNKASINVFVPLKLREFFAEKGYASIHELDWYESVKIDDLQITALPSVHYSSRGVSDKNKTLWCSWAIFSPFGQYYFIGDSAYSPNLFNQISEKFGAFDLAMIGIGTYGNRKYGVNNHTTPEEAVLMGRELNANALLGIHWGTIDLSDEDPWEPPERFQSAAEKAGYSSDAVWLMRIGETRILPERSSIGSQ